MIGAAKPFDSDHFLQAHKDLDFLDFLGCLRHFVLFFIINLVKKLACVALECVCAYRDDPLGPRQTPGAN